MANKQNKAEKDDKEPNTLPSIEDVINLAKTGDKKHIADSLGLTQKELEKLLKNNNINALILQQQKKQLVNELLSNLIKLSQGFDYTEDAVVTVEKGRQQVVELKKYQKPDRLACQFLLNNLEKGGWSLDWSTTLVKQKEYQIKKKLAENVIEHSKTVNVNELRQIRDSSWQDELDE